MKLCYDSKGNPYIQQYHKKIANVIDIDECNDLVDTYNSITSTDELNNEIEELEDTISSFNIFFKDLRISLTISSNRLISYSNSSPSFLLIIFNLFHNFIS